MEERDILAPVDAALKLFAVNDAATQTASRKLMVKALRNLEREPSNEKFRKLRVANKVVQAKIINVRGAQQLMACGGFYNKGEFLEALGEDCAVKAKAVADALEKSDGSFRVKALLAHSACVRGVAVDAQGFLATGALDNVVRLWDGKGQLVHELRGHEKPAMADGGVLAVALMENGGRVLSGGRDGRLLAFLRDASAANCYVGHGEPIDGQARPTNAQNVSCVACEGDLVLTGSWDRTVIKWNVTNDAPGTRYGPFPQSITGICILQGGAKCAVSIGDGTLACFDPLQPPPSTLWTSDDAKGAPMRGCCSAAGCVGTASNDGLVRLFDAETGSLIRGARTGAEGYLYAVCGSDDAIYAGGEDGIVTKFHAPSLQVALRVPQPAAVWSLAVCGSELFCGLDDHFGAVLWTSDPSAALEGPVATSIEASCHEAATKAALLVPENVLEGAAARASNQGAAGGEVSMGGTPPPPPNPNYDFSFPVELAGRPGLQINWNRGDDPNMVAIQFCDDNGIPRDQLGDVAVFVQNAMASQS